MTPIKHRLKPQSYAIGMCLSVFPAVLAVAAENQAQSKYVMVRGLPPAWQRVLLTHGDRLQKPGKERLSVSGTITRPGAAVPYQLTYELPNQVRYHELAGTAPTTLVFDGSQY